VQWLQLILTIFAATGLVLAALNCGYFVRYAIWTDSSSRRAGALALGLINAGFAAEAGAFLTLSGAMAGLELLAASIVRPLLCTAVLLVSALVWRQSRHG
jgi:hypothetical protein